MYALLETTWSVNFLKGCQFGHFYYYLALYFWLNFVGAQKWTVVDSARVNFIDFELSNFSNFNHRKMSILKRSESHWFWIDLKFNWANLSTLIWILSWDTLYFSIDSFYKNLTTFDPFPVFFSHVHHIRPLFLPLVNFFVGRWSVIF